MGFDRSKIPQKQTWVYLEEGEDRYGVTLDHDGVTFWAEIPSDEMFGGGGYRESFRSFLRRSRKPDSRLKQVPEAVREEIRKILRAART